MCTEKGNDNHTPSLKLWVRIPHMIRCTRYNICDQVCQWLAGGWNIVESGVKHHISHNHTQIHLYNSDIFHTSSFWSSFSQKTFIIPTGRNPIKKQRGHNILAEVDSAFSPGSLASVSIPQIWGSMVINIPTSTIEVHIPRITLIPEINSYIFR